MFKNLFGKMKTKFAAMTVTALAAIAAVPAAAGAEPIDFTGIGGLDVKITDVVGTGFNFMNMFGEYTSFILGLIFAPVVIGFVIWIWRKLPKFGGGKTS